MKSSTFIEKIKSFILNHKVWSIIIAVAIIITLYFIFRNKTNAETRYITNNAEKSNIVISIEGSGQIESTDTVDISTKISGIITYVPVKVGQEVKKGTLIASIDSRDAKIALETAQLSLDKLLKPDDLTILQKENSLKKTYTDSWNSLSSYVVDMDSIIVGLGDLHNTGYLGYKNKMQLSKSGKDKLEVSENAYWDVKKSLETTSQLYKSLSSSSSNDEIKNLINTSLDTAKKISNAVKLAQDNLDFTSTFLENSTSSTVTDTQKDLTSWSTSVNSYVNTLSVDLNNIGEISLSLNDAIKGPDELDLRQAQLNVETKRNTLSDYYVAAPFDGIVATLTAKVGQSASGSIGTLIAKQKLVKIALNEVDIAKIKLGQKATLTFDAIDGLTITGTVEGVDSVGTVSQGVVTYNVTISLDVDDVRVKPGMSVSATIVTNIAQDVLVVPNSAIKTGKKTSYVEVFSAPLSTPVMGTQGFTSSTQPKQVEVKTGLSNDTSTEIISGLKEGDIIVVKTIISTNSKNKTSAPSILGAVGGSKTGTGSGAMRAIEGH